MPEQVKDLTSVHSEQPLAAELQVVPPGPWSAVLRHKRIAVCCFSAIMLLTACVILFYPRKYHSVAKLNLRDGRENVALDPTTSTTGDTQTVHRTRESEVLTAIEMMTSREILQGIVDEFGTETILSGALPGSNPKELNFAESGIQALKQGVGSLKRVVKNIDPISDQEQALITLENNLEIS
ncbi:MAG: hypothetical protein ACR2PZ_08380, partial [Pseudomonadales bacterium]